MALSVVIDTSELKGIIDVDAALCLSKMLKSVVYQWSLLNAVFTKAKNCLQLRFNICCDVFLPLHQGAKHPFQGSQGVSFVDNDVKVETHCKMFHTCKTQYTVSLRLCKIV